VLFNGGNDWRWLDLKTGTITVMLSPGGGKKNDGLRRVRGTISQIGSCSYATDNYAKWSFKADGVRLRIAT
jgi:hypothetical protein